MEPKVRSHYPVQKDFGVTHLPAPYVDDVNGDGTLVYTGYSDNHVEETDLKWLIVRKTVSGTVTKYQYPDGSMEFTQAWASRATLNYAR